MNDEQALTFTEAAEAARVHRNTIRRRLDKKQFPNAYKGNDGQWRVPVSDLTASGLTLHGPAADLDRLRAENADLRRRAEVSEAEARERERALELAERVIHALEARTQ